MPSARWPSGSTGGAGGPAANPSWCRACGSSCPKTSARTGRSASSSSTSSTPAAGARPTTSGAPRPWPSSWPATPAQVEVLATAVNDLAATVSAHVDVLAELATAHEPSSVELDLEAAEQFLEQAPAELERLGIELVGPERLVRATVAVRGTVTPAPPSDQPGGFVREAIVDWRLVVADDDGPAALSAAELARAETAGATLLHTGRRWVRIDPAALRRARTRLEDHVRHHERVDAVALLRLAGEGEFDGCGHQRRDVDRRTAGRAPRRPARRGPREHRLRRRSCGRTSGAGSGGCGSSTAWDSAGAWPTTWASARRPRRWPTSWTGRVRTSSSARCRSSTTGWPRRPDSRPGCTSSCTTAAGPAATAAATTTTGLAELAGADIVVTTYGLLPRDLAASRRDHLVDRRARRGADDQEPGDPGRPCRAGAARRAEAGPHRHARREPPRQSCGPSSTPSTPACSAAASSSAIATPSRSSGPATPVRPTRLRRITQPFVLRRTKADRQLVPDLPDKIEQIAWAGADP